jgi:hypothetical protein
MLRHDFRWCWTGVAGWGRVALRGTLEYRLRAGGWEVDLRLLQSATDGQMCTGFLAILRVTRKLHRNTRGTDKGIQ